ncbi:MAG: InlB B-repeat-containing protein [Acholeplasmataceae bacterium]
MKKSFFILFSIFVLLALISCTSDPQNFTVSFNTNGGTEINDQIVSIGELVPEPVAPEKAGYSFDDWYLNDELFDFNTPIIQDIILEARWLEVIIEITYTVTFDSDGGTSINNVIVNKEDVVMIPAAPEKAGFTFEGWYLDNQVYNFNSPVNQNITLKARWLEVVIHVTYAVTFDADGGSPVDDVIVNEGNPVQMPIEPTKDGFIFKGWYIDDILYNFNDVISKDITLKAKWELVVVEVTYTVTFDTDGGSPVNHVIVNEGNLIPIPIEPTKDGFIFDGWYLDDVLYNFNDVISKDIILKAKWEVEIKVYTVTFNTDGADEIEPMMVNEGDLAPMPIDPNKDGFVFEGWFLDGDWYDFSAPVISDLELIAVWTEEANPQAYVETSEELLTAINNPKIEQIFYRKNIELNLEINRPIYLNLATFTHTGNITVTTDEMDIASFFDGFLDGDLIINSPNLTVYNNLEITGSIIINQIAQSTLYEFADGNTIHFYDDHARIYLYGEVKALNLYGSDVRVLVTALLEKMTIGENVENINITNADKIERLTVNSDGVFIDKMPVTLLGSHYPRFPQENIYEIVVDAVDTLPFTTDLNEIKNHLPNEITLLTNKNDEQNARAVPVQSYTLLTDISEIDEIGQFEQVLEWELTFNLPFAVYNRFELTAVTTVTIGVNPEWWVVEPESGVLIQTENPDLVSWIIIDEEIIHYTNPVLTTHFITLQITVHKDYQMDKVVYYNYENHKESTASFQSAERNIYHYLIAISHHSEPHAKVMIYLEELDRPDPNLIYSGGTGTIGDPFKIGNHEEFEKMHYYFDDEHHFELISDIIFPEDYLFTPIRTQNTNNYFRGSLNGNNHQVENLTVINDVDSHFHDDSFTPAIFDRNYGTIQAIKFINIYSETKWLPNFHGLLLHANFGTIENIRIDGMMKGKGSGLVGFNYGSIKNIDISLVMENSNNGIAYENYGTIKMVTVDIVHNRTDGDFGYGHIAGITHHNSHGGLITNFEVNLVVNSYVDSIVKGGHFLEIAGVVLSNNGLQTDHVATIQFGTVHLEVYMLGEHRYNNIAGIAMENTYGGYIADIEVNGTIHGDSYLAGGIGRNGPSKSTNLSVIENILVNVDLYGTGSDIAGLVILNGNTNTINYGPPQIINSQAYGNVEGKENVSNFILNDRGGFTGDSYGNGNRTIID